MIGKKGLGIFHPNKFQKCPGTKIYPGSKCAGTHMYVPGEQNVPYQSTEGDFSSILSKSGKIKIIHEKIKPPSK